MKLTGVISICAALRTAAAAPAGITGSWDIEGFAKDNPIGPTTGGEGGETVTVTTFAELKTAVSGTTPRIVLIKGNFESTSRLSVGSNKSLIGVSNSAFFNNSGINVQNQSNVIIRNLRMTHVLDNDCITIRNSTRVWVDHNEFWDDISTGPDKYVSAILPTKALDPVGKLTGYGDSPGWPGGHHSRL